MKKLVTTDTGCGIFAALFLLVSGLTLPAMDWPTDEAVLYRNFGWNEGGQPLLGMVFEGEGQALCVEAGELLYFRRDDDTAGRLPSPLGSWVAVDHGDGIVSVYSRLAGLAAEPVFGQIPLVIEKKYPLAALGQSGWSERWGLYFSLFDRKERRWVNPSMIINPFPDTAPPLIRTVRLHSAEGLIIDPGTTKTISQGRYTISVGAVDFLENTDEPPLAPYRLICSINGSEIGGLSFETYSSRDGVLLVNRNGLAPAREAYAPFPGFDVGEIWLTRGQVSLEIIAQDIAGNIRSAAYRFAVE